MSWILADSSQQVEQTILIMEKAIALMVELLRNMMQYASCFPKKALMWLWLSKTHSMQQQQT